MHKRFSELLRRLAKEKLARAAVERVDRNDLKLIQKRLIAFWFKALCDLGVFKKGRISRILHKGKNGDGFLKSDTGKSIYFKTNTILNYNNQVKELEGLRVYYDTKDFIFKGKKTVNAVNVFLF